MVTLTFLMVYLGCHDKGRLEGTNKEGLKALLTGAASFYTGDDEGFDYNCDKVGSGQDQASQK